MRLSSKHLLNKKYIKYIIDMINFLKRYSKKIVDYSMKFLKQKIKMFIFNFLLFFFFPSKTEKRKHTFFCPYMCEFLLALKKKFIFNLLLYLFIYSFQNLIVCMHKHDYIFDKFEQKSSPIVTKYCVISF